MTATETSEVGIVGGGLAGLCLAIQLKRARPDLSVTVVERRAAPRPDAAFKVGESSVEIASLYFMSLGLEPELKAQLPKFGLRFFFTHGDNRIIEDRLECGPSRFFFVPSYQLDRGSFENALSDRAKALGVEVIEGARAEVELGKPHILSVDGRRIACRWLVDASGRASVLKRKLGLGRGNRHTVNAAWFRIDEATDLDEWSERAAWRGRVSAPRRLSTNHFMGPGYWAWVIPLANQKTSIGIVADDALHPFDTLRTQEAAAEWLERHEPQLAERVGSAPRLDFLVMRDYSHSCRRVFDAEARWAITGEAGYFTDPLYSPGSDFIALANDLITDLIVRDHAGLEIEDRAQHHARTYASTYRAVMSIYEGQYPIMGSPRAMTMKILWDFTMYWSSIALVYRQGGFVDPDVMMRVRPMLLELAELGKEMQDFFRAWATLDGSAALSGFVDYSSIPFLERLNRDLLSSMCEEEWVARLATNISFLHELGTEIRARVSLMHPELGPSERPGTTHVASTFATLFDEANVDRHASA